MFVIPVSPALSVDSEHNSNKVRKNPMFGLKLTGNAEQFLKTATDIAAAHPESRFKRKLQELMEVLVETMEGEGRENDGLRLEITHPLRQGIEAFTEGAKVKLENLGRVVEGKAQSLTKVITNSGDPLEGETIIDVALGLLADKKGKALSSFRFYNAITKAQEAFKDGVEQVSVNLRRNISGVWTPNNQQVS